MGMAEDLKASEQLYNALVAQGLSPNQAWAIARGPSYPETQTQDPGSQWNLPALADEWRAARIQPESREQRMLGVQGGVEAAQQRRERPISYQPGGNQMPGMLGDDQSRMSPQDMARLRLMMQILQNRGTGGMQQNPLMGGGQQAFGAQILQNPQLLQWLMQQQNGGVGNYPQGGGVVDLAQQPFRYPVL